MGASPPSIVLTGHDIYDGAGSPTGRDLNISASADTLRSSITALKGLGYRFCGLDTFLAEARGGGLALVTFDDAYKSVLDVAAPIMAGEEVPGVVFVITGMLERGDPVQNLMILLRDRALDPAAAKAWAKVEAHPTIQRLKAALKISDLAPFMARPSDEVTRAFQTHLPEPDIEALAEDLARTPGIGRATMTEAELRRLTATGRWNLGAHSVNHRRLSQVDRRTLAREVEDSIARVAAIEGRPASKIPFAYPYGSHSAAAARMVARAGSAGFTTTSRPVSPLDSRALLPRINIDANLLAEVRKTPSAAGVLRERAQLQVRAMRRAVGAPLRKALRRG